MIHREIKIDAPIQKVFSTIRDFQSYPTFVKGTSSAKESKLKDSVVVDFEIDVIKKISYRLSFQFTEPTLIEWKFVKGDLMKKNSGRWVLVPLDDKTTQASYEIDIDFGWMVPKMIVDQLTKTQLPEMLDAFKKRAEAKS